MMITHITPREQKLADDIDKQGRQLVEWRDRAIAAEAEIARLRAAQVAPVAWDVYVPEAQHGYLIDSLDDPQYVEDMTNCDGVTATPLYAAPPAQQGWPVATVYERADGFGIHIHGSVQSGQFLYANPTHQAANMTDKITIERETLERAIAALDSFAHHGKAAEWWVALNELRAALEGTP